MDLGRGTWGCRAGVILTKPPDTPPALLGAHLFNHPLHLQLQGGQAPSELLQQPLKLVLLSFSCPGRVLSLSQPGAQLLHVSCQCLVCDFSG